MRHGFEIFGRPAAVALAEPTLADLGLTSMARARHALRLGDLLTKTGAVERADARSG